MGKDRGRWENGRNEGMLVYREKDSWVGGYRDGTRGWERGGGTRSVM